MARSMLEWWARRCRRWSKKPMPVLTSARPSPSRARRTFTYVSPVCRSASPTRCTGSPLASNGSILADGGRSSPEARRSPALPQARRIGRVQAGMRRYRACRSRTNRRVERVRITPGRQGHHSLLRTVTASRYVAPLREGGSLPAVVEADDLGTYVLKFRGAGQGRKALVAELVVGELARALGLSVPEIVLANLDPKLARTEPDPEIQDLIRASGGLNLALDFLLGSLGFDPLVDAPDPALATRILWFDALVQNVDRSPRNTNLLAWHGRLWLIDHGASLYFHHAWRDWRAASKRPYAAARDHVLLPFAGDLFDADIRLAPQLAGSVLREIVVLLPEEWLRDEYGFEDAAAVRAAYVEFLSGRLEEPRGWVGALEEARGQTV